MQPKAAAERPLGEQRISFSSASLLGGFVVEVQSPPVQSRDEADEKNGGTDTGGYYTPHYELLRSN